MIVLHFKSEDGLRVGIKTPRGILDIRAAQPTLEFLSLEAILDGGPAAREALDALVARALEEDQGASWMLEEEKLVLAPCVPRPGKIICVGLNYRRHAEESGMKIPEVPVLFSKFNNSLAAHGEPVPLPSVAREYDYEVELCVVMGRRARYVAAGQALDYVAGYCNANDVSARDLQMRTSQWLVGKTLDKFLPLGPYLVTADEIPDPQRLGLRCWVNGDLRQNSATADMIFSVAELVSYISRYLTLQPCDLILTGTPEGVIFGRKEKDWLKPGDLVTVEVDGLGRLSNRMADERGQL